MLQRTSRGILILITLTIIAIALAESEIEYFRGDWKNVAALIDGVPKKESLRACYTITIEPINEVCRYGGVDVPMVELKEKTQRIAEKAFLVVETHEEALEYKNQRWDCKDGLILFRKLNHNFTLIYEWSDKVILLIARDIPLASEVRNLFENDSVLYMKQKFLGCVNSIEEHITYFFKKSEI